MTCSPPPELLQLALSRVPQEEPRPFPSLLHSPPEQDLPADTVSDDTARPLQRSAASADRLTATEESVSRPWTSPCPPDGPPPIPWKASLTSEDLPTQPAWRGLPPYARASRDRLRPIYYPLTRPCPLRANGISGGRQLRLFRPTARAGHLADSAGTGPFAREPPGSPGHRPSEPQEPEGVLFPPREAGARQCRPGPSVPFDLRRSAFQQGTSTGLSALVNARSPRHQAVRPQHAPAA